MNKLQNIKIRLITLRLLVLRDRYPMPPRGKTCPYIGYIIHQCVDINALANLKNLTRAHVVLEVYLYVKFMLFLTKVKISLLKKMKHLFSLLAFDTKLMKLLSKLNTLIKKVRFHKKLDGREEAAPVIVEEPAAGLFYTSPFKNTPLLAFCSPQIVYFVTPQRILFNQNPKRSMMTLKRILPKTCLVKVISVNAIQRKPSYMAPNTILNLNDCNDIKNILYENKQYLLNLDLSKNQFDFQMFKLYEKAMSLNPKYAQHVLSVLYAKAQYSLLNLQNHYPEIKVFGKKNNPLITEYVVVAATGASIMKNNSLFKNGQLNVLSCDSSKNNVINKIAFEQTQQQNPDYFYVYNQKLNNGKVNPNGQWTRYYDFKTGQFKINTGHIFFTSNKELFEEKVTKLLLAQKEMYKKNISINREYERILNDKNLSVLERNHQIQNFFRDNLHKYPNINPSFIIYNPKFQKIDNQDASNIYENFITQENMNNVQNCRIMLAKILHAYGPKYYDNYIKHPYSCPIIVGFIRELIQNKL